MRVLQFMIIAGLISSGSYAQNPADVQQVKKVISAFTDDFNKGDFKNAANYATKEWIHINPGGGMTNGRDEVLGEVIAVHKTFLKDVHMTTENMTVRMLTPDVAIATVIHKIDNYTDASGIRHANEKQIKTYIVVKQKGKWLLTLDQNTIVTAKN